MKNLNNIDAELKKSVTYKKKRVVNNFVVVNTCVGGFVADA